MIFKSIIIQIFLFYFVIPIYSQILNIGTQKTFGGTTSDIISRSISTSDGGIIVAGSSTSGISGDKTENNRGGTDFWVVKFDSNLSVEWQKTIGGSSGDNAYDIKETIDGGFIVVGPSASGISGDKTSANIGGNDYWIVKLNSIGTIIWDKSYGGIGSDILNSIIIDSMGNIYLGGHSDSGISGNKTEASRGFSDYWIIKLDSSGNQLWDKTIGGSSSENFRDFVLKDNGEIIIYGMSLSDISGEKSENSFSGSLDMWIVKINNSGNVIWDRTLGGDGFEFAGNSILLIENCYYVICSSSSGISGVKTEPSQGSSDYWVVKLNENGQIIWDKTIGGLGSENAFSLLHNSNNQILISGASDSNISGDKTENSNGMTDSWLVSIDTSSTILWQKTIGGSLNDYLVFCNEISPGFYLLSNYSNSNISGDKTENCRGNDDYWLVKLNTDLSIPLQNTSQNFEIYPNPTNGIVEINFYKNNSVKTYLKIQNSLGESVYFSEINSDSNSLRYSMENYTNGIYYFSIYSGNVYYTKKIVLIK